MRPGVVAEPVGLSTVEFAALCEAQDLTAGLHDVLDAPSPGASGDEWAELVSNAWAGLRSRRLAEPHRDKAVAELADLLELLNRPQRSVDVRIWADRPISALAAARGNSAVLAIVDGDVVELVRLRSGALAAAAVSVAGAGPAGEGRPVSLPHAALREASERAGPGNVRLFIDELRSRGVGFDDATTVARMADGMAMHGQFGAEHCPQPEEPARRAGRVVGFHDTDSGRYLHVVRVSGDGRDWSTIAPASNDRIAEYVAELLTEAGDGHP